MRNLFKYILLLVSVSGFNGCISEYVPKNIEKVDNLLVVSGIITNRESTFNLSRSVGLLDNLYDRVLINNATVYIETNEGDCLNATRQGEGNYIVETGTLSPQKKYRLCISLDGEEYQSDFLSPLFTPEIDSLSVMKKDIGEPVYIAASTYDPENQSNYFRWTYEENWEVKAELYAEAGYVSGELVQYSPTFNTYYCWGRNVSKKLTLASSDKLAENIIYQKVLVEIPCDDDRLSVLYHIAVNQIQIRKEAYDYFSNMQKNVEQTGSIFAPVPSEISGNIRCISHPDLSVMGYIEVSSTTKKELYVWENQGYYEPPIRKCARQVDIRPYGGYLIYTYSVAGDRISITYAPDVCLDCRIKKNATKTKPDFWPTDHL